MMKKAILTLMTLVLLASSFACIDSGFNVIVTQGDLEQAAATDGVISRQIIINSGDTFTVTLFAYWTAGMRWSYGVDTLGVLRTDGLRERIYDPPLPPMTVGGVGNEVWFFKALEEGVATITMTYGSVGLTGPPIANTLILEVKVK